ncbi:MAG: hypothetical protein IJV36_05650 [Prevotella sp.]|nr:hypothetical protein [Prevotella sp.]
MKILESIWQFDMVMSKAMAERGNAPYSKELTRLLELYRKLLNEYSLDGTRSLYEEEYIYKYVKKQIFKLKKLFEYYSNGKIGDFDAISASILKTQAKNVTAVAYFPTTTIEKDSFWYRARKADLERKFVREEMYHIRFQKRGLVGIERFSLVGYPCLYLGKSLKCVDVETGNPAIKAVSCFKTLRTIDMYDFTFFSSNDRTDKRRLYDNLLTYPFKIAASIPVISESGNEKCLFFPEYIIPQLLLHWAIKSRKGRKPEGILYSSTKAITNQVSPELFDNYVNMVVPTLLVKEKGLCSHLDTLFSLTEPEIVPFSYWDDKTIEQSQEIMKQKQFLHIDVDYDPKD